MAVDSRDKRMSMIGLALPAPALAPNPDGSIGAADRGMLLWLYHGIAPETPSAGADRVKIRLLRRGTIFGMRIGT